jgi:hypothetical protein
MPSIRAARALVMYFERSAVRGIKLIVNSFASRDKGKV